VIPVCPASWSPKSHQRHWRPTGIWKGLSMLCGQCPHGLRARTPHKYTCQWSPSYSWCLSCCLSAAPLPGSWSARQRPRRFEQIVAALVTECVHATGDCTRAPCWWCTPNYSWGAWDASTSFHLMHQVLSPTSIDTLLAWRMTTMERVPTIFFAWFLILECLLRSHLSKKSKKHWYKYVDTCRGGKIWIKRNQSKLMWYY